MRDSMPPVERWVLKYGQDPGFVAEGLSLGVIEEVLSHLGERDRKWLAEAMGVRKSSITSWLNAPTNLTLLSVARMAVALGLKPRLILDSEAYSIKRLSDVPIKEEELRP